MAMTDDGESYLSTTTPQCIMGTGGALHLIRIKLLPVNGNALADHFCAARITEKHLNANVNSFSWDVWGV